jgi:hypothetical protein
MAALKYRSTARGKEKNVKHPVKKYLRDGAKAIVFLAIAAMAVWYGLVFLLVYRAH